MALICSGPGGSLGMQNVRKWLDTYGSSSGFYGSLGTQTAWEWLDVHDGDRWVYEVTGDPECPYKGSYTCGSYSDSCGSLGMWNTEK